MRGGGDGVGLRRGCQGEEKAKRRRDTHRTNGGKGGSGGGDGGWSSRG